ncbi:MAG: hypothetical protein OP8BY_1049 [Candidatus Saccharicenans subterraneus]|uniref:DUF4097 domain-containing protein n=1 Tax=Candidatus Saccharicenans subterraneus TaxID=2508984 RepID=A0A3E2BR40_9BACT|nr:MAG: hypothetical protein OP8BY_1049 [Candidatus Saccharicenans subterraneum]
MRKREWKRSKELRLGLALMLGLLLIGPLLAGDTYQEKFEKTERLARDGRVAISNVSGDIKVMVWKEEMVKIEAVKSASASTRAKAKESADKVTIEVTTEPGLVRIETRYPESRRWFGGDSNVSVDYTLWIPDQASFESKSVSGDVEVEKAGGPVRVSTVSGSVTVLGGKKSILAKAVSGDIRVTEAEGDLELNSVSGDIRVSKVRGSVEAEVVSGSVRLEDISGARRVSAKSISGTVEYRGQLLPDGNYRFTSHSGEVRLYLPADSSFNLEASSFSGTVSTDFPVEVMGKLSGKSIQGRVGKGGAEVVAKAFSGSVEIRKGS